MRVIAGKYKSRPLKTVKSQATRPTTDKNKENLFNIIGPYFEGGVVLDLFAGSGGLGIEAISRGMDTLYSVDKAYNAFRVVKENVDSLKIEDAHVLKMDYRKAIDKFNEDHIVFDLVFLDPPYRMKINKGIMETLAKNGNLSKDALIVVEDVKEERLSFEAPFECTKERDFGITVMQFVRYRGDYHA
jgi:16S rRNA (guanine966-N2)-methyltransferase